MHSNETVDETTTIHIQSIVLNGHRGLVPILFENSSVHDILYHAHTPTLKSNLEALINQTSFLAE